MSMQPRRIFTGPSRASLIGSLGLGGPGEGHLHTRSESNLRILERESYTPFRLTLVLCIPSSCILDRFIRYLTVLCTA